MSCAVPFAYATLFPNHTSGDSQIITCASALISGRSGGTAPRNIVVRSGSVCVVSTSTSWRT